ncbi:bile acid:sodium symporter family protein [Mesonia ostreae]|uniref:Bile acid:sodium symporter family protein n=1 Tax=Mesonia ostreae TaxID=861110 RepID=A0ABU2KEH5_9FLAO|nr:bile acid:sodium symporter family protein [Mesonia ostreae]MDT0293111.1 bile acid:sodium symporter family protein [Mesonia ostreae]
MKKHLFILALLLAILASYVVPQLSEILPLRIITDVGIAFIFFFYGLKLSPTELKLGMRNYKLHLLIQAATFIVFPVLVLLLYPVFSSEESYTYWLAFLFLAALPSTVSSSVVMVSLAKGNIPAAIFNASLSGIIGVVITPLWLSFFLDTSENDISFLDVFSKLGIQILIPLGIGFLLHKYVKNIVAKYKGKLSVFDKSVIVLIVYNSFSHSFKANIFSDLSILDLITILGGVVALFFTIYALMGFLSKKLHFSKEDEITARFCGSKKSLVHGSVMLQVLFGNAPSAGIFLIPIMLYHIFQLMVVAVFANKFQQRKS